MSDGRYRQRSEPGRRQGFSRGDGYAHSYGYGQAGGYGTVGRGGGGGGGGGGEYGHSQDFAATRGSYNVYDMYAQRGYGTGTPQDWGYDGYDNFAGYSTDGNDSTYLYPGDGSGHDGYSNYSTYGGDGYAESSSYLYYPTHQPPQQRYTTANNYSSYGRQGHGNYSSNRSYSSYSSQQQPQPYLQPQCQESTRQRRASPVYNDYTGSTSRPSKTRSETNRRSPSPRSSETHRVESSSSLREPRNSFKEKRTKPTDEYLAISSQPSHESSGKEDADSRGKERKLIVLDLNGTLVLRGQHRRAAYDYVSPTRRGPPSFQVRAVYPRPDLSTFIEYILHDETKTWLDAMVWSSAQPRSVDDMVGRSFGERRAELRAVWARDTLGLSNEDYHKKSITLKDLEKPWAELPFTLTHRSPSPSPSPAPASSLVQGIPHSTPSISRASSPAPLPPSSQITVAPSSPSVNQERDLKREEYHHSALSTLLIDDSPVKASLQPWNHLCIREYVADMRKADLDTLLEEEAGEQDRDGQSIEQEGEGGVGLKKKKEGKKERHRVRDARLKREAMEREAEMPGIVDENGRVGVESSEATITTAGGEDEPLSENTSPAQPSTVASDTMAETSTATSAPPSMTHEDSTDSATRNKGDKEYDQTLLAVIGVLDRIRHERNVAGWMRAGGLMRVGHDVADINAEGEDSRSRFEPRGKGPTPPATTVGIEAEKDKGKGKGKSTVVHTPPTRSRDASPLAPSSDSKKRRRIGESEVVMDVGMEMDTRPDVAQNQDEEQRNVKESVREAQEMTGIPLESSPPTPKPSHQTSDAGAVDASVGGDRLEDENEQEPEKPKLWFEHPEVFAHWVERGKMALRELDIAVVAGIRR